MKKNIISKKQLITGIITLVAGLLLGWLIFSKPESEIIKKAGSETEIANQTIWTCSMHPQIRQTEPGDCPICGMELIPVEEEHTIELDPDAVRMSPTAMQLANVSTARAGTMAAEKSIRLNGKVQADERLVFTQSSHVPGRIEQLNVDFTGEYVNKGSTLALVYSPDLVTAQEELFEARKMKDYQPELFDAVKEKLKRWKLTDNQINEILDEGKPLENFNISADVSGYVTEKYVNTGDYVRRGEPIYEIAGLSKVWVLFDVYESDMPWVNEGDLISFTVPSLPGENFESRISYIDPVIDPRTRVARARVEINNKNLHLKPEMFASGVVKASLSTGNKTLIIPKSAVMWTGERSLVYVKSTTDQGISFKMREVNLGPSLGDGYVIKGGLDPDEEIAVHGTFSIDAAAQLAGKPSMMNQAGGTVTMAHNHESHGTGASSMEYVNMETDEAADLNVPVEFREQLTTMYMDYLVMKNDFVETAPVKAGNAAKKVLNDLEDIDMGLLSGRSHKVYMKHYRLLKSSLEAIAGTDDIEVQRKEFAMFNDHFSELIKKFGLEGVTTYYQYCPMANQDKGAYWFSETPEIRNPYFGDMMLTCGETRDTIR